MLTASLAANLSCTQSLSVTIGNIRLYVMNVYMRAVSGGVMPKFTCVNGKYRES